MLSQTLLSQISMYIQIFIPMNKQSIQFNNQFNNLIIAIKRTRRQIKDSRSSDAATESQIGILWFLLKIAEKCLWKISFWQCSKLYACSLTEKWIFFRHLLGFLPKDSVGKITQQLFWRRPFQLIHFQWLLLFMSTISKKKKNMRSKHIKSLNWNFSEFCI